eukprot:scaffold85_cov358-Pavlova_lutheri.AAC.15
MGFDFALKRSSCAVERTCGSLPVKVVVLVDRRRCQPSARMGRDPNLSQRKIGAAHTRPLRLGRNRLGFGGRSGFHWIYHSSKFCPRRMCLDQGACPHLPSDGPVAVPEGRCDEDGQMESWNRAQSCGSTYGCPQGRMGTSGCKTFYRAGCSVTRDVRLASEVPHTPPVASPGRSGIPFHPYTTCP